MAHRRPKRHGKASREVERPTDRLTERPIDRLTYRPSSIALPIALWTRYPSRNESRRESFQSFPK